jgi:hypothetical protein
MRAEHSRSHARRKDVPVCIKYSLYLLVVVEEDDTFELYATGAWESKLDRYLRPSSLFFCFTIERTLFDALLLYNSLLVLGNGRTQRWKVVFSFLFSFGAEIDKLISDEVKRDAGKTSALYRSTSLAIIGIIRRCTNIFNGVSSSSSSSSSRVWLVLIEIYLYLLLLLLFPIIPLWANTISARLTGKHSSVLPIPHPFSHSTIVFYPPPPPFEWMLLCSTMTYFVCVCVREFFFFLSFLFKHFTCASSSHSEWNAMQFNRYNWIAMVCLFVSTVTYTTHHPPDTILYIDKVSVPRVPQRSELTPLPHGF